MLKNLNKLALSHVALFRCALFLCALLLVPSLGFAESAGHDVHHGQAAGVSTLLWPAINFAIYLGVLAYVVRRMVNPALKARAAEVEALLKKAQNDITAAQQDLKTREIRLQGIAQEQKLITERLSQEGTKVAEEVLKNADLSVQQVRGDVQKRIDQELKRATTEVRELVVEGAGKRARELLKQSVSADEDRRLRQEAINGLFE